MNYNEQLRQKIDVAKQRRIEASAILKAAKPWRKTGFAEFIQDMLGLGLRNVFYGIYDAALLTVVIAGALFALLNLIPESTEIDLGIYGIVFATSPAVYLIFFLLSYLKERSEGGFDVKMTCRYTALHLCAFRMFLCGVLCMVFNAAATGVIALRTGVNYAELTAVSFSSLFLFAMILILALLRFGVRGYIVPAAVMAACAVMSVFPWYNALLRGIPTAAYVILGAVLLVIYQSVLNKINRRFSYAVR